MRTLFNLLILLVFTQAIVSFPRSQTNESNIISQAGIIGTYRFSHRFGGVELTLAADGTYSSQAGDCTTEYAERGAYTFTNNVITLTVSERTARPHSGLVEQVMQEGNNETSTGNEASARGTIYRLMPVRWSDRLYLINEDDLLQFCNAINAGVEPRQAQGTFGFFGTFYLRAGDENKPAAGIPEVPETWRAYILNRPVTGRISDIRNNVATVNIDRGHGLKEGMQFVIGDREPSIFGGLRITSVAETTVEAEVYDNIRIGDVVSTRSRLVPYSQ
jgi:hypothetical protein